MGNAFRIDEDIYINPKPLTAAAWPSDVNDAVAKGWLKVANIPDKEGYIKTLAYNSSYPLISTPATVGGDSSRPVGDYFYRNNDNALKILLAGGSLRNGLICGAFYVYVSSGFSYSWFDDGSLGVFRPR